MQVILKQGFVGIQAMIVGGFKVVLYSVHGALILHHAVAFQTGIPLPVKKKKDVWKCVP